MFAVVPFSVKLQHVLFAGFEPRCEKRPDHFQTQEIFVATVYGLSTIWLDLLEIIWFSHSVFFIIALHFLWFVNQWIVISGRLCSDLKAAASPTRPKMGRA